MRSWFARYRLMRPQRMDERMARLPIQLLIVMVSTHESGLCDLGGTPGEMR
jgi:hypothetical protein